MIVYVVLKGTSEDACSIAGVFLTKRLADRCAGRLKLKRLTSSSVLDFIEVQAHEVVGSDSGGKTQFEKGRKP